MGLFQLSWGISGFLNEYFNELYEVQCPFKD
jgi:hypothetical protein